MADGRVVQINVSDGGVPKRPVPAARITPLGVEGDRQRAATVHGGPLRAVSILGIEAIRRVAAEGHPIAPGTTGENLTIEGFDVSLLRVGTRLEIGTEVILELASPAAPCRTIRHSFEGLRFGRLGIAGHPADSRMYARVVRDGTVRTDDPIRVVPPADDAAERHRLAGLLDDAERTSSLTLWRAAASAGAAVAILDDGDIAAAASPQLAHAAFNQALGFAHMPNLVDRAIEHFRRHDTIGWVWADEPPWPGATADGRAIYAAGRSDELLDRPSPPAPPDLTIRQLERDEISTWSDLLAASVDFAPAVEAAWRALEPEQARDAHVHRFVAQLGGEPVGTGLLHTHHGVGWLRAGTVLPAHRGRGIQAALIRARTEAAKRLGCELVGASATAGSASARNLERLGFVTVDVRERYRVDRA
ncbi:MAG TPA: GNAT family N-acetyltransferase [Vitreimonas sp.]|nr:GNAT family N-acetyltransferase [Vitreimonas sp.]